MIGKKLSFGLIVFVLCCQLSCIDEIPLETNGEVDQLVIAGRIHNGQGPYSVKIERSGDFSEDQLGIGRPVGGATVVMRGSDGSFSAMIETEAGSYITTDLSFQGKVGIAYTIEVTTTDGESYQSTEEKLLPVPTIQSIETEIFKEDVLNSNNSIQEVDFIRYLVNTSMPQNSEGIGLKWNFGGVYEFLEKQNPATPLASPQTCYITQLLDLNKVVLQEGKVGEAFEISGKEVFNQELDFRYANNFCFHLYQQSLTPEAFAFWNKVEQLIGRTGSLFETPPGKIKGNISNINNDEEVLGYFYATAIDTLRIYTSPRDLDLVVRQPCDSNDPELEDICFNCTLLTNSTLTQPSYWE